MNKIKVANAVKDIAEAFNINGLTHSEKYASLANSLIITSLDHDLKVIGHPDINWRDAFEVERAFIESASTDNNLAAILQAHIILKWASLLEEGTGEQSGSS